jgi:hypothetical protein
VSSSSHPVRMVCGLVGAAGASGCARLGACRATASVGRVQVVGGDLAGRSGLSSRAAVLAALWDHVALPESVLSRTWPALEPGTVADLVAYFETQGRGR